MDIIIHRGSCADITGIAETIAEAFYDDFKTFCESKKTIVYLLSFGVHPERFIVAADRKTHEIIGTVGITDSSGYPLTVPKKELNKEFGFIRGRLAAKLLAIEFYRPKEIQSGQANLSFVAVKTKSRGHGIAKKMIEKIFEENKYHYYTLDVVEGNEKVIPIYEAEGFEIVGKEDSRNSKRAGVNFRYLMEKHI